MTRLRHRMIQDMRLHDRAEATQQTYVQFAIKFLFRHTLRRPLPILDLIRLRRDSKLPAVLSRNQARQLLTRIRRPEGNRACVGNR